MKTEVRTTLVSNTLLIMLLTFLGYIVGFGTQVFIAQYFGAGKELDTFIAASVIPEFFLGLANAIFFTAFIVFFPEYLKEHDKENGKMVVKELFNKACLILFPVVIILIIFSPFIAKGIGPGFTKEQLSLTTKIIKILSLAVLFYGLSSLAMGILFYEHKFLAAKSQRIILGLSMIGCLLLLRDRLGVISLAIGLSVGAIASFFVLYCALKKEGYAFSLLSPAPTNSFHRLFILSLPLLITSLLYYINKIVTNIITSTLEGGSLSALNYAFLLINLPIVFFSGSVAASIFPRMTKHSAYEEWKDLSDIFNKGVRVLLLVFIPLTFIFLILKTEIITLLFQRGAFTIEATAGVSKALFFFALGLIPNGLIAVMLTLFYALKKMKDQIVLYSSFFLLNITLSIILKKYMSYSGIALASSITYWIIVGFGFWYITKNINTFDYGRIVRACGQFLIASFVMALFVYLLRNTIIVSPWYGRSTLYDGAILSMILLFGFLTYVIILKVLKSSEERVVTKLLIEQLRNNIP